MVGKRNLVFLFLIISCGKDSPFSETYWEDGNGPIIRTQQESIESYNVTLASIIGDQNLSGTALLNINLDQISMQINMLSIPTNINVVRFSVSDLTCDEIRSNGPPAPVTGTTYRNLSFTESGNKTDFLEVINQGGIQGRNLVVYGLYGANLPGQVNLVFPLACGSLRESVD